MKKSKLIITLCFTFIILLIIGVVLHLRGRCVLTRYQGFSGNSFVERLSRSGATEAIEEYTLYRKGVPFYDYNGKLITSIDGCMNVDIDSSFCGYSAWSIVKDFFLSRSLSYNNRSVYSLRINDKPFLSINPHYVVSKDEKVGLHDIYLLVDDQ